MRSLRSGPEPDTHSAGARRLDVVFGGRAIMPGQYAIRLRDDLTQIFPEQTAPACGSDLRNREAVNQRGWQVHLWAWGHIVHGHSHRWHAWQLINGSPVRIPDRGNYKSAGGQHFISWVSHTKCFWQAAFIITLFSIPNSLLVPKVPGSTLQTSDTERVKIL